MSALSLLRIAALAAFGLGLADAIAAEPTEFAGSYALANADGSKVCALALHPEPVGEAFQIELEASCGGLFPAIAAAAAWAPGARKGFAVLDAAGQLLASFETVGDGMMAARAADGLLFLSFDEPATGGDVDSLAGTWAFTRAADGDPICLADLDTLAAGNRFVVEMDPQCDPAIGGLGLATWAVADGAITLHDAAGKTILSFARQDGAVFVRSPAGPRPLFLVQQFARD